MNVKVKISTIFQQATGGAQTATVNGSTVGECLQDLIKQYPDLKKMLFDDQDRLASEVTVFINEEHISGDGLSREVKDGDEIYPMILIGGG